MTGMPLIDSERVDQLITRIARKVMMPRDMILPYVDFTDLLTDILRASDGSHARFIVGGLASPEVAMAADKAGISYNEISGPSPFTYAPERLTAELSSGKEIVYLANPNRVTGSNLGLADLEIIAQCLPDGLLILDEHYFDFYAIGGASLCEKYRNVVILRSLTGPFGIGSDQSGFVISTAERIDQLKLANDWNKISYTLYKILMTSLTSTDVLAVRLKSLHDESLRIAQKLGQQKIQTRISATDFLLLRVANPMQVTKYLNSYQVEVHNLESSSGLENYVRYRIQSFLSNDNLLMACAKMPQDYYQMQSIDKRQLELKRQGEETPPQEPTDVVQRKHVQILKNEATTEV